MAVSEITITLADKYVILNNVIVIALINVQE